jgi:prevent-host-death family protein
MKTIGARDLREDLSSVMKKAQKDVLVVTKHGQPSMLCIGVEGMTLDDIETCSNPAIWEELDRRRTHGEYVDFDDAMKELGITIP